MTTFSSDSHQNPPHIALLPSAGMGHLVPFARLAAALSRRKCTISFVAPESSVSLSESNLIAHLLASFPSIQKRHLPIVDLPPSEFPSTDDPFHRRTEAIRQSAPSLPSLLSSLSPPPSAVIVDIFSASAFAPVASQLSIPCYILFTSSALMLSFVAYFPTYISTIPDSSIGDIDVPSLPTIPKSSVPAPVHDPEGLFAVQLNENGKILSGSVDGILLNTFLALEADTIAALKSRRVVPNLAPVFAIGPLCDPTAETSVSGSGSDVISWLDRQPRKSVVYVSFGSRTAMQPGQIRELGVGLERSRQRFLWVIKTKKVDKEEEETGVEEVIGEGYEERVKERGLVVKGWVEQREMLSHEAVGGFVSHCGWNSVTEAAASGVRVLGWPLGGDQRMNAEVVRRSGLGVWMEEWPWEGEGGVVSGEEIARRVKEMMEDEELEESAGRVGEEARRAVGEGGSSEKELDELISRMRKI